MDSIAPFIGPAATVLSAAAPIASSLLSKAPKAPNIKIPTLAPTPVMPTTDDASAQAASMKAIALRASQHGRNSTNLYEKSDKLGA